MDNDDSTFKLMLLSLYTASSVVRKAIAADMEHKLLKAQNDLDMDYYRMKAEVDIAISLSEK